MIHYHADSYDLPWPGPLDADCHAGDGLTSPVDDDALHCDFCETVESAADLTPDWNGETGNHRSCEDNDVADRAANAAMGRVSLTLKG